MKISAVSSYIETLQFTCDVIFDDTITNVTDLFNGLSNALDRISALDISLLMEESIQPEVGKMWKKLIEINQMKCERFNKIPFSELTLEKFLKRKDVIYERFPLIQRVDNMSEGAHSLYTDFELVKLLLESNVDGPNLIFTKCNDVIELLMDKQIEFQNLYSEIEHQSNIQKQMESEQQNLPINADDIKQREIPIGLQSKDAQRLLSWLVESKYLTESFLPTDKLNTKRKLAYLSYKMSKALNLGKNNRRSNDRDISWQPFEKLFNTTGLGNTFNQLMREYDYDVNGLYPDIDAFFD